MKAMVLYDSVFGNTEQIARAIGAALGSPQETDIVRVSDLKPEQLKGLDLLIVGSPTRAFRPTKGIQSWLKGLSRQQLQGIRVTAFDTRMALSDVNSKVLNVFVKIFGYAAEPIARQLKKKGGNLILPPEGFFVKTAEGPLKDGELERAAAWAGQIQVHP